MKHIWIIEKYNTDKIDWCPVAGVSFKTKKEAERFLEYEFNCIDKDIESGILGKKQVIKIRCLNPLLIDKFCHSSNPPDSLILISLLNNINSASISTLSL